MSAIVDDVRFLRATCPVCRQEVSAYLPKARVVGIEPGRFIFILHLRPQGRVAKFLGSLWPWTTAARCAGSGTAAPIVLMPQRRPR